ncbi:MAG: hypothetical protein ACPIOQ_13645 [Promethearchaeia archaeon]
MTSTVIMPAPAAADAAVEALALKLGQCAVCSQQHVQPQVQAPHCEVRGPPLSERTTQARGHGLTSVRASRTHHRW